MLLHKQCWEKGLRWAQHRAQLPRQWGHQNRRRRLERGTRCHRAPVPAAAHGAAGPLTHLLHPPACCPAAPCRLRRQGAAGSRSGWGRVVAPHTPLLPPPPGRHGAKASTPSQAATRAPPAGLAALTTQAKAMTVRHCASGARRGRAGTHALHPAPAFPPQLAHLAAPRRAAAVSASQGHSQGLDREKRGLRDQVRPPRDAREGGVISALPRPARRLPRCRTPLSGSSDSPGGGVQKGRAGVARSWPPGGDMANSTACPPESALRCPSGWSSPQAQAVLKEIALGPRQ